MEVIPGQEPEEKALVISLHQSSTTPAFQCHGSDYILGLVLINVCCLLFPEGSDQVGWHRVGYGNLLHLTTGNFWMLVFLLNSRGFVAIVVNLLNWFAGGYGHIWMTVSIEWCLDWILCIIRTCVQTVGMVQNSLLNIRVHGLWWNLAETILGNSLSCSLLLFLFEFFLLSFEKKISFVHFYSLFVL